MKAVYKRPGLPPEIIEVENTLKALQEKVEGWLETVTINSDACIICNEEGRLRGMARNMTFLGIPFVGPILVVGIKGENFCDLPRTQFWRERLLKAWRNTYE